MNKISPAQYRAHYYKEVDQIFILPRFSCASSPTISINSGDCGIIIFLLIKLKIQTRSNDRFGLKLGTVLAQLGQRACPSWATCLPLLADLMSDGCPISWCCNTHIPDFRILPAHAIPAVWITHSWHSFHLTIPHTWQFLTPDNSFHQPNHPDNRLTIARQSTICLSECYNQKPDNLTVFRQFLVLLKISDMGNFYSYRQN